MFTGFLFGTHKLQKYILGAIFILSLFIKRKISEEEKNLILIIPNTRFLLSNVSLWYFVFDQQKSHYLQLFMFCMTTAMYTAVIYLTSFLLEIGKKLKKKKIED